MKYLSEDHALSQNFYQSRQTKLFSLLIHIILEEKKGKHLIAYPF